MGIDINDFCDFIKAIGSFIAVIFIICIAGLLDYVATQPVYAQYYHDAEAQLESGDYKEAINTLEELSVIEQFNGHKNSEWLLKQAKYFYAVEEYANGNYDSAKDLFSELGSYADSSDYLDRILNDATTKSVESSVYETACAKFRNGDYDKALELFNTIPDYSGSQQYIKICKRLTIEEQ